MNWISLHPVIPAYGIIKKMRLLHPLVIFRILGTVLLIETISFFLCLIIALIYGEPLLPFLLSSAVTGALYLIIRFFCRKANSADITKRDTFLIVTLAWVILSALGTLPYIISGTIPSFIDAFFETASGFTTTGNSVITDVEVIPYSIHFWRSLTHWIGGLGIVALVIIILPTLKVSGYQLFSLEASMKEKFYPKTKGLGFRILVIYLALTIAEIVLLVLGDMNLFDSICHSFGTVATGGFSTKNNSLQYYSSYSQYVVMIFMFLSGVSLVIYYHLINLNFKKIKQNDEFWFYGLITIIAGAVATLILLNYTSAPPEAAFRNGFFTVISIITTTGYASSDFLLWPVSGLALIFILYFAGASTGSTTGAIKMGRHLIVLKNLKNFFIRLSHPHLVHNINFNGKPLTSNASFSIITFVLLYLLVFIIGTLLIIVTGSDPITSATAVAASLGNVGPGLGTIGPMSNYAHLPQVSKLVLSLLMIIGRLEIYTVFVIFSRSFWKP